MQLIIAGIIGGLVVLFGIKFTQKKMLLKFLFKIYYVFKDYALTAGAEAFEKFKDVAAESKAEYDKEKTAEREVSMKSNME